MNEKMQAVREGTEVTETGMVCLEGEAISRYRLVTLISSYALEINTGMKATRIPLSRVAEQYGVTARNKKKALTELLKIYEGTYGEPLELGNSLVRALAK
jgi:hypothetical protein